MVVLRRWSAVLGRASMESNCSIRLAESTPLKTPTPVLIPPMFVSVRNSRWNDPLLGFIFLIGPPRGNAGCHTKHRPNQETGTSSCHWTRSDRRPRRLNVLIECKIYGTCCELPDPHRIAEPWLFADVLQFADGDTMTSFSTDTTSPATPIFEPAPSALRSVGALASVAAMLIGTAAAFYAARAQPEPLWAVAGLQVLVVVGGFFGLVWSKGRFESGPVLALLCAAGSVLVGGMLAFVANRGMLGPIDMKWWAVCESFLALTLGFLALVSAVARDRESRVPAVKGALLCLPALGLLVCVVLGDRLGMMAALAKLPTAARIGLWLAAGFMAAVMLCMAAHHFADAFGRAAKAGHKKSV